MDTYKFECVLKQQDLLKIGLYPEDPCPMCLKHKIEKTIGEHLVDSCWTPQFEISPCPEINSGLVGKSYKEIDRNIDEYENMAMSCLNSLKTAIELRTDGLKNSLVEWSVKARKQIIKKKRKEEKAEVAISTNLDLEKLVERIPDDIIRYIGEFVLSDSSVRLKILQISVDTEYSIVIGIKKMPLTHLRILALNILHNTKIKGFDSFYFKRGQLKEWKFDYTDYKDFNDYDYHDGYKAKSIIASLTKTDLVNSIMNKLSEWKSENVALRVSDKNIHWDEAKKMAVLNHARCVIVNRMFQEKLELNRLAKLELKLKEKKIKKEEII